MARFGSFSSNTVIVLTIDDRRLVASYYKVYLARVCSNGTLQPANKRAPITSQQLLRPGGAICTKLDTRWNCEASKISSWRRQHTTSRKNIIHYNSCCFIPFPNIFNTHLQRIFCWRFLCNPIIVPPLLPTELIINTITISCSHPPILTISIL